MLITAFAFLLLNEQIVEVVAWDCLNSCLTCPADLPYLCTSCRKGSVLQRGGAYYSCEPCGMPCVECSNKYTCSRCLPGYYGKRCRDVCSKGCINSLCTIQGICGCKKKCSGAKCDRCINGRHGDSCASSCPGNCVSCSSETACDICKEGHWGSACQNNCSHGCLDEPCMKGLMASYLSFAINCFGTK